MYALKMNTPLEHVGYIAHICNILHQVNPFVDEIEKCLSFHMRTLTSHMFKLSKLLS